MPSSSSSGSAPRSRPTVGLWVHRVTGLDGRTGVGRYSVELSRALWLGSGRAEAPAVDYCLLTGRERGDPPARLIPGPPVRRSWVPARALHLAWMGGRRPYYDQVGPRTDLVHVLFPSFPMPSRAPVVVTIHDLFTIDHPEWYQAAERRAVARSTRLLAAEAAQIVCVSGWVRAQVIDRLGVEGDRVRVVHSGVSDAWHRPPCDAGDRLAIRRGRNRYVVAVGAVTPRKNLALVVRALASVPEVDLVVAGPVGEPARSTMQLVEALGLQDRVHVTGRVSDKELIELVQGAEALVHPSLDEGFGFPPLEAMAAGTPAIVAASGSLPEVVGDGGVVLPADDPDRWAGAITDVAWDGDHRVLLVARGVAHASRFTWERAAADTSAIHREVLGATAHRG